MRNIFNTTFPVSQKFLEPNTTYKSGVHMGTDYACPVGTPIYAPLDGQIVQTFDNNPSMGNCVIYQCVKDGQQYQLRLMHLSACYPVSNYKEGDVIAVSGNTGRSEGPHLHIDVSKNAIDWQGIKTKEGVMNNMVDFEKWNEDETAHKAAEAPTVSTIPAVSSIVSSKTIWLGFIITVLQAVPVDVLPPQVSHYISAILGGLIIVNRFFTTGSLK